MVSILAEQCIGRYSSVQAVSFQRSICPYFWREVTQLGSQVTSVREKTAFFNTSDFVPVHWGKQSTFACSHL